MTSFVSNKEDWILHFLPEIRHELANILDFWMTRMVDHEQGGFYGEIDGRNRTHKKREKGSVLNARILWTFSAAYHFTSDKNYLSQADRAFHYFVDHFIDKEYGGVYWSLDYLGNALNRRKQLYAIAFAIYGLTEYHRSTGNPGALEWAIQLFNAVESWGKDEIHGGYIEAFSEKWETLDDVRLSEKDQNDRKSMNTHLHILEAYTNLYRAWPDPVLLRSLKTLVNIYQEKIIDSSSGHQNLFFDENWEVTSSRYSYGHDIEASWLLWETAEIMGDKQVMSQLLPVCLRLADVAMEGLDTDFGLMNEIDAVTNHSDSDKHWWPQAEAMVGFLNAYQLSGEKHYLDLMMRSWEFIKKYLIDTVHGEWYWRVNRNGQVMTHDVKAGFWKCPYHNTRACMEILRRLNQTR
jgi:mannobiose 2-epimerase